MRLLPALFVLFSLAAELPMLAEANDSGRRAPVGRGGVRSR